jgi:pullulanase
MDHNKILEYYNYFSTREFDETYRYDGNDLGAFWSKGSTLFRLWAPTAGKVELHLFAAGDGDNEIESIPMNQDIKGTWVTRIERDLNGIYYTYSVTVEDETNESVDPYAKAVGVNGNRGMVIDLASTNPEGFTGEVKPALVNPTDAVIYELHIRDFSVDISSGMKNKGKYLALTEAGTKNSYGAATGLDYLGELGITHIHLLPSFDYATVDESRMNEEQYNWGYDPKNYNVPEGSYSTDPYHGEVRIKEFKQMIWAIHQKGIRIIMDVVYNHLMDGTKSNFNRIVPAYYYRLTKEGYFSNASGCGNETASERSMMRKFIIDSVVYWATQYHIDGFRFDLMGVHDIRTMNEVREALDKIDPSILVYGEGWTGGLSTLPEWERAVKNNMGMLKTNIAAFHDNLRDGLKGSVFSSWERGFINGQWGMEETIKYGVVAATYHPKIDYNKVLNTNSPWAKEPAQTINYASAHDNLTLWDKLTLSNPSDSLEDRVKMNLLSASIILTSQGIPFIQAGEEFLRSKPKNAEETEFEENSYRSSDVVNSLKWDRKTIYREVFDYYQGLIRFRRAHKLLRLTETAELQEKLNFLEGLEPNVVAFVLAGKVDNKPMEKNHTPAPETSPLKEEMEEAICVIYNANREAKTVPIPEGEWKVFVKGKIAGNQVLEIRKGNTVEVEPISTLVIVW